MEYVISIQENHKSIINLINISNKLILDLTTYLNNNTLNTNELVEIRNNLVTYNYLDKSIIKYINTIIYKLCSHNWVKDTSCSNELSSFMCEKCKLYK